MSERIGVLCAIFVASGAGEAMKRLDEATLIEGRGIEGDRYASGKGRYSPSDVCEVTLITAEAVARLVAEGFAAADGEHRRNLVVAHADLERIERRCFSIGPKCVLQFDRPRPPCGYLERITRPGMTRAMGRAGAGLGLHVLRGGTIRVGDALTLVPGMARRPRRKLP